MGGASNLWRAAARFPSPCRRPRRAREMEVKWPASDDVPWVKGTVHRARLRNDGRPILRRALGGSQELRRDLGRARRPRPLTQAHRHVVWLLMVFQCQHAQDVLPSRRRCAVGVYFKFGGSSCCGPRAPNWAAFFAPRAIVCLGAGENARAVQVARARKGTLISTRLGQNPLTDAP